MDTYAILKEDDLPKSDSREDGVNGNDEHEKLENPTGQNDLCPLMETKSNGVEMSKSANETRLSSSVLVSKIEESNKKYNKDITVQENVLSNSIQVVASDNDIHNARENRSSHDKDESAFVFVSENAEEFGFGSSDADQFIRDSVENDEEFLWSKDKKTDQTVLTSSMEKSVTEDFTAGRKDKNERDNQAFMTETEVSSPTVGESDKSPLLPEHALVKDLVKKIQPGAKVQNDKVPLLPSPAKTELSSEEDSTLMSVSLDMELDSLRSPGQPSSDADGEDQGVCSKYSQLSEDGSTPTSIQKMKGGESSNDGKPSIFENSLELGVAFSEFVDMELFSSSLGQQHPQTEDRFGGKFEDHLLVLLKSASHKNLKSFLRRSGWPAESDARRHLWENLCVHLVKAGGNLYNEMAIDVCKAQSLDEDMSLPSFVDHKMLPSYHLNTFGVHTVKMVVNVFGRLNPDVLFCPILYPLASAFLHYMGPNACHNCMQALLRSSSPTYLTATLTSTRALTFVLMDLAKKYAKSAYVYITRGADESVFDGWLYWLFRDLPFQTMVCVIDCYLLEGNKVLYRVALAVLSRFTKHMKKTRSGLGAPDDMRAAISSYCTTIPLDPKKLMKIGFSIRGLTRKEIYKLEARHQANIRIMPLDDDSLPKVAAPNSVIAFDNIPEVIVENERKAILTKEMLSVIWAWVPKRLTMKNLSLLYTSDEDGITLRTLFGRVENTEQTIFIIETEDEEIFGAFCSTSWSERRQKDQHHISFFGTGETFVFTVKPTLKRFQWVGVDGSRTDRSSDMFMAGDDSILMIGSGHGEAIQLDAMMSNCRSTRCDTFNNEPLSSKEDFRIGHGVFDAGTNIFMMCAVWLKFSKWYIESLVEHYGNHFVGRLENASAVAWYKYTDLWIDGYIYDNVQMNLIFVS